MPSDFTSHRVNTVWTNVESYEKKRINDPNNSQDINNIIFTHCFIINNCTDLYWFYVL